MWVFFFFFCQLPGKEPKALYTLKCPAIELLSIYPRLGSPDVDSLQLTLSIYYKFS